MFPEAASLVDYAPPVPFIDHLFLVGVPLGNHQNSYKGFYMQHGFLWGLDWLCPSASCLH